jgi:hypothetical protein
MYSLSLFHLKCDPNTQVTEDFRDEFPTENGLNQGYIYSVNADF